MALGSGDVGSDGTYEVLVGFVSPPQTEALDAFAGGLSEAEVGMGTFDTSWLEIKDHVTLMRHLEDDPSELLHQERCSAAPAQPD